MSLLQHVYNRSRYEGTLKFDTQVRAAAKWIRNGSIILACFSPVLWSLKPILIGSVGLLVSVLLTSRLDYSWRRLNIGLAVPIIITPQLTK